MKAVIYKAVYKCESSLQMSDERFGKKVPVSF